MRKEKGHPVLSNEIATPTFVPSKSLVTVIVTAPNWDGVRPKETTRRKPPQEEEIDRGVRPIVRLQMQKLESCQGSVQRKMENWLGCSPSRTTANAEAGKVRRQCPEGGGIDQVVRPIAATAEAGQLPRQCPEGERKLTRVFAQSVRLQRQKARCDGL